MSRWNEEPYDENWFVKIKHLEEQVRYLAGLNRTMINRGCRADLDMGHRVAWLEQELGELKLYRDAQDGSTVAMIGRMHAILSEQGSFGYADVSPARVLDVVLEELQQYAKLKTALRELHIVINYQTVFPEEEEQKS